MATEEEKRLHRCCFSGHRPEKLDAPEEEVKQWLSEQIYKAIAAGYTTFISGCAMGVDIWAGQIVLQKKEKNPAIHEFMNNYSGCCVLLIKYIKRYNL